MGVPGVYHGCASNRYQRHSFPPTSPSLLLVLRCGAQIFPGLARYAEVAAGSINHALRFTASKTRAAYQWPARHYASNNASLALPPMGLRVRLKKVCFDASHVLFPSVVPHFQRNAGLWHLYYSIALLYWHCYNSAIL